jgi:hypothetical protein
MNDREVTIVTYDKDNSRTILKTDSIVDSIVDKFIDRARIGQKKYGTNLDRTDFSLEQWIEHALEEHMDAILYLQKIKSIIGGTKTKL